MMMVVIIMMMTDDLTMITKRHLLCGFAIGRQRVQALLGLLPLPLQHLRLRHSIIDQRPLSAYMSPAPLMHACLSMTPGPRGGGPSDCRALGAQEVGQGLHAH